MLTLFISSFRIIFLWNFRQQCESQNPTATILFYLLREQDPSVYTFLLSVGVTESPTAFIVINRRYHHYLHRHWLSGHPLLFPPPNIFNFSPSPLCWSKFLESHRGQRAIEREKKNKHATDKIEGRCERQMGRIESGKSELSQQTRFPLGAAFSSSKAPTLKSSPLADAPEMKVLRRTVMSLPAYAYNRFVDEHKSRLSSGFWCDSLEHRGH